MTPPQTPPATAGSAACAHAALTSPRPFSRVDSGPGWAGDRGGATRHEQGGEHLEAGRGWWSSAVAMASG
jgi:hypothetical protein